MAGPTDLFDAAAEFLEACKDALEGAPGGAAERCFVSPGPPAWDTPDQLTVHVGGPAEGAVSPGSPALAEGHRVAVSGSLLLVSLTATVLRSVPVVGTAGRQTLPTPSAITEAAAVLHGDLWAIFNHCRDLKRRGRLFAAHDGSATTREMMFDPVVSLNPAGGIAGWQIPVRVQVDGYRSADG